jgi:hypothetical protein
VKRCTGCKFNAEEGLFSEHIGQLWTSFAAARAPWSAFTEQHHANIVLQPGAATASNFSIEIDLGRPEACALWDEVDALQPEW